MQTIGLCLGIFAAAMLIGAFVGLIFRRRAGLSALVTWGLSVLFFAILEWRLGSAGEWSWQYPFASAAYLFGGYALLLGLPSILTSVLVADWWMRRETSNQAMQRTPTRRSPHISNE